MGVGQRTLHSRTPATPPAKAVHVIATGIGSRGPSALISRATRHSDSEAEIPTIMMRVAMLMPRAWRYPLSQS